MIINNKDENDEFLFLFSKNPTKMIFYFSIKYMFLLNLNSRIERILKMQSQLFYSK